MKITIVFYLIVSIAQFVHSNTIFVPKDKQTIQAAIDFAGIGDTIRIDSGKYVDDITITKSLVIIGNAKFLPVISNNMLFYTPLIKISNAVSLIIENISITSLCSSIAINNSRNVEFQNINFSTVVGQYPGIGVVNSDSIVFRRIEGHGGEGISAIGHTGGMWPAHDGGSCFLLDSAHYIVIDSSEIHGGPGGHGGCNSYPQVCVPDGNQGYALQVIRSSTVMAHSNLYYGSNYFDSTSKWVTDVKRESKTITPIFYLEQNYPNPFNPTTTIRFTVPNQSFVSVEIFNPIGNRVTTIVAKELAAGKYIKEWNAQGYASGVYFYRMVAGKISETKKLILMR